MTKLMLQADFNGLFGKVLCLSHGDTAKDEAGNEIALRDGMIAIAFDHDTNEKGERDDLIAGGVVRRSPEWLRCNGSTWALFIDDNGVRNQSDIDHTGD